MDLGASFCSCSCCCFFATCFFWDTSFFCTAFSCCTTCCGSSHAAASPWQHGHPLQLAQSAHFFSQLPCVRLQKAMHGAGVGGSVGLQGGQALHVDQVHLMFHGVPSWRWFLQNVKHASPSRGPTPLVGALVGTHCAQGAQPPPM